MNKKSGLLGVSGLSSDLRDIEEAAAKGEPRSRLALAVLTYGIRKYIGAYAAAMGGIDALVFTAGVGENSISGPSPRPPPWTASTESTCRSLGSFP